MTKSDLPVDNSVVEALEQCFSWRPKDGRTKLLAIQSRASVAAPLAKRQAEAEAALIETKAALRWLHLNGEYYLRIGMILDDQSCPPIIKEMLREGK